MLIDVSEVQLSNARLPIAVMESGMLIVVSEVQP